MIYEDSPTSSFVNSIDCILYCSNGLTVFRSYAIDDNTISPLSEDQGAVWGKSNCNTQRYITNILNCNIEIFIPGSGVG